MKKIIILIVGLLLITGCSSKYKTDFAKRYQIEGNLVETISFNDFKKLTASKTGIVFIGDDSDSSKSLASIFVKDLCDCDVNKAHYISSSDVNEEDLKEILNVKTLNYPIVVAYRIGKQTSFYDNKTKTDNLTKTINDLVLSAYPTVCTDAC